MSHEFSLFLHLWTFHEVVNIYSQTENGINVFNSPNSNNFLLLLLRFFFSFFLHFKRRDLVVQQSRAKFIGWLVRRAYLANPPRPLVPRVLSSHANCFAWSFAADEVKILHITGRNFICFHFHRGSFNIIRLWFSTINLTIEILVTKPRWRFIHFVDDQFYRWISRRIQIEPDIFRTRHGRETFWALVIRFTFRFINAA